MVTHVDYVVDRFADEFTLAEPEELGHILGHELDEAVGVDDEEEAVECLEQERAEHVVGQNGGPRGAHLRGLEVIGRVARLTARLFDDPDLFDSLLQYGTLVWLDGQGTHVRQASRYQLC